MDGLPIQFLIGKHTTGSLSPTGRSTRGYVTFNMRTKLLCFLKDAWRPNTPRVPIELEVYRILKAYEVSHVATAIAGGDVAQPAYSSPPCVEDSQVIQCTQRTITQEYIQDLPRWPLERFHCRLALKELARPLETSKTSAELICSMTQSKVTPNKFVFFYFTFAHFWFRARTGVDQSENPALRH